MKNWAIEHLSDAELLRLEEKILSDGLLKLAHTPNRTFSIRRKSKTALRDIFNKSATLWGHREHTIDVETQRIQCNRMYYRRSQGDLFRIMKYYYPDTTFKKFRSALFELVNEGKVQATYCPTINKRVFLLMARRTNGTYTFIHDFWVVDELGLTLKIEKKPNNYGINSLRGR